MEKLASTALSSLPREFGEVTLDRFPEVARRSRLIRNMITSFVFRGHLSPLITSSELKSFAHASWETDFEQAKTRLILLIGNGDSSQIKFVEDLFAQVVTSFSNIQPPGENDPGSITRFYKRFGRDLLVLDPISEEQTIITMQERIKEGSPHLWEDGVMVGNYIVPSVDKLVQAAEQETAKDNQVQSDKLYSGVKIWQWLQDEDSRRNRRANHLEEQLKESFCTLHCLERTEPSETPFHFLIYSFNKAVLANA